MGITAYTGPLVSFGQAVGSSAGTVNPDYNPQSGPSLFYQGVAILDQRPYYSYKPGQGSSTPVYGWWGTDLITVIDAQITAPASNTIAQTQTSTTVTSRTITLTASNTANATIGVSITRADTGATVTGLLAIEGAADTVTFGSDSTVNLWDPSTMVARTLQFSGSSDDSAGVYTVSGYDVYGYPMTEVIAGSASTGTNPTLSIKAWKYISTIVASGTFNSTGVLVGVSSAIGFPLAVASPNYVQGCVSSDVDNFAWISSGAGPFTLASTVATQTSTTPDVRGTFISTTGFSSQGRRYTFYVAPSVASLNSTGFYGAQQA